MSLMRPATPNTRRGSVVALLGLASVALLSLQPPPGVRQLWAQPGPTPAPEIIYATIYPTGDTDEYPFDGMAGDRVQLRMWRTSGELDPFLALYAGETAIASDDNSGGDGSALIDIVLPTTASYRVVASGGTNSMGGYGLSLAVPSIKSSPTVTREPKPKTTGAPPTAPPTPTGQPTAISVSRPVPRREVYLPALTASGQTIEAHLPELAPYQPDGWDGPVVPASQPGTSHVSDLFGDEVTYVDFALMNSGASVTNEFLTELFIDGRQAGAAVPSARLATGQWAVLSDFAVRLKTGWHQFRLVVDSRDDVSESDETNNVWEKSFYWRARNPSPVPTENDPTPSPTP